MDEVVACTGVDGVRPQSPLRKIIAIAGSERITVRVAV